MTCNIHVSSKCHYLFIIFVFCFMLFEVEPFIPAGRLAHSSILVGNKIYFFGGVGSDYFTLNELFYLDVSKSFNVANPPWVDLAGIPFGSAWATVVLNDINNDPDIYLFGGIMRDMKTINDSFTSIIHRFNINSLTWDIPSVIGNLPERRREVKAINNFGMLYIF